MITKDIAETVRFLRKEGYDVFICLSEVFPEECRKELSEFCRDGGSECVAVFFDNKEIAKIGISGNEEKLSAISLPLRYMIERLYERAVPETNEHDIYRKALQYIKAHYTENITVSAVADYIGYSESYFGYTFKKKYKMSVSSYVRELQLAKAKDLLENTSFSVSSVASYVGFDDPNYFSALFKKYFGLSPKEYRKAHSTLV